MYKISTIDKKTGKEIKHERVEEVFVGRWVTIFLNQGFNVFIKQFMRILKILKTKGALYVSRPYKAPLETNVK